MGLGTSRCQWYDGTPHLVSEAAGQDGTQGHQTTHSWRKKEGEKKKQVRRRDKETEKKGEEEEEKVTKEEKNRECWEEDSLTQALSESFQLYCSFSMSFSI